MKVFFSVFVYEKKFICLYIYIYIQLPAKISEHSGFVKIYLLAS